jgi:hypothetical protein
MKQVSCYDTAENGQIALDTVKNKVPIDTIQKNGI